ncbi:DUF3696 domain-containing protein [Flavobacterium flavipallidum]|uniref:DUF3696 domain-containing protein n=1 Tax=Flavobacterium flavipallidum TaxID=3139140 RepID=A0ABU9HNW6_9FLAO
MFNLYINNFRSFKAQNFNFSKINILIGENSGGKSSLLKFLLALKQTIDNPLESNLKLKGDYTDLGNYDEVIYNKKYNQNLSFHFSNNTKYPDYFLNLLNEMDDLTEEKSNLIKEIIENYVEKETKIEFILNNKLDDHTSINTIIKNEKIGQIEIIPHEKENDELFRNLTCSIKIEFDFFKGTIENITGYKEGFFTYIGNLKEHIEKDFDKEIKDKLFFTLAYLLVFQNYMNEEIDQIRFVNPIGNNPKRFYFQEDKKSSYKLIDIEKFINILGDKHLSANEQNERINLINKTIKEFGIAEEIKLIKNKDIPVLTLNVKTKGYWSNITDVGYGVSLQIPILFQALLSENYTKNGQTIIIEQPEVHLHPSLQAKFIETLLSIGSKNSYFIETHSEHIIRKLQVLIKNNFNGIKPEDISIYYFKRSKEKFDISEHKINKDGKLSKPFPEGFFDTSYNLVKELM